MRTMKKPLNVPAMKKKMHKSLSTVRSILKKYGVTNSDSSTLRANIQDCRNDKKVTY